MGYRVVLCEDHAIVREGLRFILGTDDMLEVVCEAGDGLEAIRCAQERNVDLVLLDLNMPKMNGLEAIREIKRVRAEAKVLVLTAHRAEEYVFEALRAGADGYVLKGCNSAELLLAVRSVLQGNSYLSPQVAGKVAESYVTGKAGPPLHVTDEELTQREREVLKLVAEGYKTAEVAEHLCISPRTVDRHRSNLMRKLGLRNVAEATAYAIQKGIVTR